MVHSDIPVPVDVRFRRQKVMVFLGKTNPEQIFYMKFFTMSGKRKSKNGKPCPLVFFSKKKHCPTLYELLGKENLDVLRIRISKQVKEKLWDKNAIYFAEDVPGLREVIS